MQALLENLNKDQRLAVESIYGSLLIIAGAGSGKTRVITHRIAYMLQKGIAQSNILALTFTNKAAKEMEERVVDLAGKKCPNLTISTFHAFGVKVLREHIELLGWRANFSIYDEIDRNELIKECGKDLKISESLLDVYKIASIFSDIKMQRRGWREEERVYIDLYEEYQERRQLFNALDFDDLIMLPISIFSAHKEVLEAYRTRYKYVMVDEFQDTSVQQYNLIKMIAKENICVVGDDDQSIYSWRGANFENIKRFERDFPTLKEIKLEQNYRSTGTILAAANALISNNINRKEKELWSSKDVGNPIEFYAPEDEEDEADFIVQMIENQRQNQNLKYQDFGILLRTNSLTRAIEEALLEAAIPYRITGGISFFQRKEVKDIISYMRVATNPDDDVNLLRIINTPPRGIGKATIKVLSDMASTHNCSIWKAIDYVITKDELKGRAIDDLSAFFSFIKEERDMLLKGRGLANKVGKMIEALGYNQYIEKEFQKNEKLAFFKKKNIEGFLHSIERWEDNPYNEGSSIYDYLNLISLLGRGEREEGGGEVSLMTIHCAKGLEFPVVFVAGVEKGLIPHERSIEEGAENIEEERRLFYVALTRARQKLFLTSCKKRRGLGGIRECSPSPFIEELPKNLIKYYVLDEKEEAECIDAMFAKLKEKFGTR